MRICFTRNWFVLTMTCDIFRDSYLGQFLPGEGATPALGKVGEPEFVEEDRVEVLLNDNEGGDAVKSAVAQLKKVYSPIMY